jgi:DNA-damage-inducible protein J
MTTTKIKSNKSNLIQVRLDDKTKLELEFILQQLGLTTSQAVLLYIKQIVLKKQIPFNLNINSSIINQKESQEEFDKITGFLVNKLDEGEGIPEMHSKNEREFKF